MAVDLVKKPTNLLLLVGVAISVWVGLQLSGRDWLAWVFLVGGPVLCVSLLWWSNRTR
jgi:hypothetical protein